MSSDPINKDKVEEPQDEVEDLYDEYEPQEPSLRLFEISHLLSLPATIVNDEERTTLLTEAKKLIIDNNIQYFLTQLFATDADYTTLSTTIKENVVKKYEEFTTKITEHEESGSEQDILEVKIQRVKYACRIVDQQKVLEEHLADVLKATSSTNTRIELYFACAKYALSIKDYTLYNTYIDKLTTIVDKEGDWDARNRFNVYNGLNYILSHNFTSASPLFLTTIQTFASTDIIGLDDSMLIAMFLAIIRCSRKELVEKVVESPEIIQTLLAHKVEHDFLQSLYQCNYAQFYSLLPTIQQHLMRSPYLSPVASLYLKEARLVAYRQFLISFQYVKIDAFAKAFGVSSSFIETDISNLISAGRLEARINLIDNIVEMIHNTNKMNQFESVLTNADLVVNKINKLTQQAKAL